MTKTLEVRINNALKAYKEADQKGKAMLENLYGKEVFSQNIIDRIKTMQDVYEENGTNEEEVIPFKSPKNKRQVSSNSHAKVMEIVHALNEGWEPDYTNSNEPKYEIWFKYTSGVGFSYDDYDSWFTDTCVGSRLCFKDKNLAKYAIDQFPQEFNEWLNPSL